MVGGKIGQSVSGLGSSGCHSGRNYSKAKAGVLHCTLSDGQGWDIFTPVCSFVTEYYWLLPS